MTFKWSVPVYIVIKNLRIPEVYKQEWDSAGWKRTNSSAFNVANWQKLGENSLKNASYPKTHIRNSDSVEKASRFNSAPSNFHLLKTCTCLTNRVVLFSEVAAL